MLRPFGVVCIGLTAAFGAAGTLVPGQLKLFFGPMAGAAFVTYLAMRESPPHTIDKWRIGSEGERRTGKALRGLPREWRVWHDRAGRGRANLDHVVMGPAGVFLLDTKNYSGEAMVEDGRLRVAQIDDPDDVRVYPRLVPGILRAAADLSGRIERATGERPWVQAVVVLWMRFPQRVARVTDAYVVHGDELVGWLRSRAPSTRRLDEAAIERFLEGVPAAGGATGSAS